MDSRTKFNQPLPVSARSLLIWLAIQSAMGLPSANGMDLFYSDAEWQTLREAYLNAVPPKQVDRLPTQIPIGLLLETTRLPKFETQGTTLAEAIVHLKGEFFRQTQVPFPGLFAVKRAFGGGV
jgi:hypothetical protein